MWASVIKIAEQEKEQDFVSCYTDTMMAISMCVYMISNEITTCIT